MKKLHVGIAIAAVMFGLLVSNVYAQEEPAPSVVGNTYLTTIYLPGGAKSFASIAFRPTGVMTITGYNGAGSYWEIGQGFAGVFSGIGIKLGSFTGNANILFLGAAMSANTVTGVGYVLEEQTPNYYWQNFPFFFSGKF
jgi:hypothetical protein